MSRPLAASIDNDSEIWSLGSVIQFNSSDALTFSLSRLDINTDDEGINSISSSQRNANRINAAYLTKTPYGTFQISLDYLDEIIDDFDRQADKLRLSLGWSKRY